MTLPEDAYEFTKKDGNPGACLLDFLNGLPLIKSEGIDHKNMFKMTKNKLIYSNCQRTVSYMVFDDIKSFSSSQQSYLFISLSEYASKNSIDIRIEN
tara:strand:+ start:79 stop:369 length:291 start_codon:yes stop_codon:yes gene_type:complete